MAGSIETMPVGTWAIAHKNDRAIVVYREDEKHWCDATGRTVYDLTDATWDGVPATPQESNQEGAG